MVKLTRSQVRCYGFAVLIVAIALTLLVFLNRAIDVTAGFFVLFFVPAILSAWYGGFKPGLLATGLTALGIRYFFQPGNDTTAIDLEAGLSIGLFILGGVWVSRLISELKTAKRSSEQLRIQESDLIINILESITDAFIHLDRDWRITYVNQEAAKLNQQKREEIIGKTHWEQWPWSVGTIVEKQYRRAMTEQVPVYFEVLYEPLNMWLDIRAYPCRDGLSIYYRDISDRKQSESLLAKSEARYRSLVLATAQAVWTTDPEGFIIEELPSWGAFTGQTKAEMLGWGWINTIHPEDREKTAIAWKKAVETKTVYQNEYRIKTADETYRYCLARGVPVLDENNQIIEWVGTLQDISDRKNYEEALEEKTAAIWQQQQWLEAALNLMPIPLLFIEPATAKVTFANQAADELAGGEFPKDKTAAEYHTVYYCTDDKGNRIPDEKMPGVRVARGERLSGFEMNWHTPEGIRSLLIYADTLPEMYGHPATGVVVFQDIAKLKQAEQAMRQSEARFRRLVESNIIGVVIGSFSGDIIEANDAFLDLIGYTREEMQAGKLRWLDITPPEYVPLDRQGAEEMVKTGASTAFEKEYIRKDGSRVPILIGAALLEGYQDRAVAFVVDLTERKQMENALRQQAEELAKTNRAKDAFLRVVSHELRTPLNSILGWAQMLRSRNLSPEIQAKALETIERNSRNQKQLIEDLLDVSRIITGKLRLNMRSLELSPIIEAAIASLRPAAENKEIVIITNLESDLSGLPNETSNFLSTPPLRVLGDPERLKQVFWNLISNAIKFTPNGGRVEITLKKWQISDCRLQIETGSQIENENKSQIPNLKSDIPYAQITVSDTGIGIKPDFLPYVFDRFSKADSTTTQPYGGLGLGLAIVRHLVELHGGTVFVESPGEGLGTTFTVKLPLVSKTIANC